jgi:serine protease Do
MWRKTKLSFFIIILIISGCTTIKPDKSTLLEPLSPGQIFQNSIYKVVLIATIDQQSTGAGAKVAEGKILTNWHIIRGSRLVWVAFYNSDYLYQKDYQPTDWQIGEVKKIDTKKDLALLSIKNKFIDSFELGNPEELKIGQNVFSISHPQGHIFSFTRGLISKLPNNLEFSYNNKYSNVQSGIITRAAQFFGWQDTTRYYVEQSFTANAIQMQFPKNVGSSGGPIIDEYGNLIGINSIAKREGESLSFAIRIDEIKSFLESDSLNSEIE